MLKKQTPSVIAAMLLWASAVHSTVAAAPVAANGVVARESDAQRTARMQWWRDARFGMFIHWGIYAVPAGVQDGKIVDAKHGSEWLQCDALLRRDQYEPYAKQFNPVRFDAEQWVRFAHDAGMKYVVITAKHHDGFSMYDTAVNNFSLTASGCHGGPRKMPANCSATCAI